MIIRPVTSSDIPDVIAAQIESWKTAYRGMIPDAILDALTATEFEAAWHQSLADPTKQDLLCEVDGQVAGYISFGPCRDDENRNRTIGEIHGLYLAPRYWDTGIGRKLCEHALDALDQSGFEEIVLWVLSANARARRFYESAGFSLELNSGKSVHRFGADLHHVRYRRNERVKHPMSREMETRM